MDFSKKELKNIAKISTSYSNMCNNFGIDASNRKHIKNLCNIYRVNIDHFVRQYSKKDLAQLMKIVKSSNSLQEVRKKFHRGLKMIRKMIFENKINTNHFTIKANKLSKLKTDKELINIFKKCKSVTDAINKLHIPETTSNYKWLRQKMKELNIICVKSERINWNGSFEYINEKLKNREYEPYIGKNLIKYGIKENICESCRMLPVWNDKPMRFECHHIDGNRKNNAILNLQILCPNCHSQTDNHSIGNRKL